MKKTVFCVLTTLATTALSQTGWTQTPAPVIDNQHVTVRDIALEKGKPGPMIAHAGDYVVLYYRGGRIKGADGKTANYPSGGASFGHGGSTSDTALSGPAREIVVDIKNIPSRTVPNTTGLPPAFPRPGSKKILENDKVRVWNYAWVPGKPSPLHFHDTEVVVVFRGNGDIASTSMSGQKTVAHHNPGDIAFNAPNRAHSEEVVKGTQSAIMLELK
jgi:quercetin dioxygenase-like cupin family protein